MRRPGRKPTSETYSVAQVACLLLATSQLWLGATSGDLPSTRAEASCPVCWGKKEIRRRTSQGAILVSSCPRCKGSAASSEESADAVAEYIRSSFGEPETVMVAMADLSVAWDKLGDDARRSVSDFVRRGPLHFGYEDVEFEQSSHRWAVLRLWRAINCLRDFARRNEGEGQAGARLHDVGARGTNVRRLPAGDPPDDDRARDQARPVGRVPSSLVA